MKLSKSSKNKVIVRVWKLFNCENVKISTSNIRAICKTKINMPRCVCVLDKRVVAIQPQRTFSVPSFLSPSVSSLSLRRHFMPMRRLTVVFLVTMFPATWGVCDLETHAHKWHFLSVKAQMVRLTLSQEDFVQDLVQELAIPLSVKVFVCCVWSRINWRDKKERYQVNTQSYYYYKYGMGLEISYHLTVSVRTWNDPGRDFSTFSFQIFFVSKHTHSRSVD